jgi:hypothetical protein
MKLITRSFLFALLSTLTSCEKDTDRILGQDDIVRIEFDTDTSHLYADDNTILQFRGIIPVNSKETFCNVTFASTDGLGEFQGTVKEKKHSIG